MSAGVISLPEITCTHESGSKREYLRETEIDRGYRLSWIYTFDSILFARDENITFWSSTDIGESWRFLGNMSPAPDRLYCPWEIDDDTASTIHIKINDTIKDDRKRSGIFIDHIYIRCFFNKVDKLGLQFYNDGYFAYLNETLVAAPDPFSLTCTVYLDKLAGGAYAKGFRIVYTSETRELQKWNGTGWNYAEGIIPTAGTSSYSIRFKVVSSSFANPVVQQDTIVWFEEYDGSNYYRSVLDKAPDTGGYLISTEVIPELPWPASLIFIPVVFATVYFTYKRRFKRYG